MNSRMWFMQLRRWCSQFIQEGSPERGNVLGFGRWQFYLENIKFTQVGHSQVVGYIYLKLRKKNKAGRIYHKPSRHQCLGIQRWLLVQGAPSLPEETEGKWEGMCSTVVSPGSHKNTKERKQEYVLSPSIAMNETTPERWGDSERKIVGPWILLTCKSWADEEQPPRRFHLSGWRQRKKTRRVWERESQEKRLFRRASSNRKVKWDKNRDKGKVETNVLNGLI